MTSASKTSGKTRRLPELLSPAGSPAAMVAAINAGADAVYFGMPEFNARIGADNFTTENVGEYLRLCHIMGVKAYVTLNTQIYDREREAFLETARLAYEAGVDAAIVGDLGAAALLQRHLPGLPIHASTQLSGHNSRSGAELSRLGFSRMVCAREMSLDDIKSFTESSPIEAEIFVHGALCVCHSGQCLFSSLVGGRSGNRGLCAQPCRLPYKIGKRTESLGQSGGTAGKNGYHLSLKDACLAAFIPEIIGSGAASLKIEGRMKPADYVGRVTAVYRRLLDEGRAATREELSYLADVFSRGGFTDRYFAGRLTGDMLGIRSEADKERSRRLAESGDSLAPERKMPVYMRVSIQKDRPMTLTVGIAESQRHRYSGLKSTEVTVTGDTPFVAENRPTDRSLAEKNLLKLGTTHFVAESIEVDIDEGLMVPVSALNALRRSGVEALESLILSPYAARKAERAHMTAERSKREEKSAKPVRAAIFTELLQIPPSAKEYFDEIYLPAAEFLRRDEKELAGINGIELPAVIYDSETAEVEKALEKAKRMGACHALVGNVGHIELALKHGFVLHGGFRLGVSNSDSANAILEFGFEDVTLSPELTLPKLRDVSAESGIACRAVVYGRIPLMIVEKCVICESLPRKGKSLCHLAEAGCEKLCRGSLVDRTGAIFPVAREMGHRNVIYNSVPVYMADKGGELARARLDGEVFIFSDETANEVDKIIKNYRTSAPAEYRIRRMGV